MQSIHEPVLAKEVVDGLAIEAEDIVLDGTLGGGGHAREIIPLLGSQGVYIGIDQDEQAIQHAPARIGKHEAKQFYLHENFANASAVWLVNQLPLATKVLLDLGWSSDQFADSSRGFSFQSDGPLDMRLDSSRQNQITASDLVNSLNVEGLYSIIKNYGEERYAHRIAREIVYYRTEHGPIETTQKLVDVIRQAVPASYTKTRIHPATRTFQALRIAVNDELGALERGLDGLMLITSCPATIAVISFHSLEDRIIKHTFRKWQQGNQGIIITKKPITAGDREIKNNPKSRSAKLRIFRRNQ